MIGRATADPEGPELHSFLLRPTHTTRQPTTRQPAQLPTAMNSKRAAIVRHPLRALLLCFAAWKALLLLVAVASPGPGYDTSTSLVLSHPQGGGGDGPLPAALHRIATRLTRWDAIYFTQVAARGYRFEQDWAFGWGLTRLVAGATARESPGTPPDWVHSNRASRPKIRCPLL